MLNLLRKNTITLAWEMVFVPVPLLKKKLNKAHNQTMTMAGAMISGAGAYTYICLQTYVIN